ncbi:uncharacterized protein LOC129295306 [Prosopis cineraria]|uniref:uncharacterized protein LOC129295306 n=1 Tax=Prosopis cineraria TaxID=364024 RepID=UPI002410ABB2|nr:uncharacterized protein LOC129295306 [Prosopis cineraria]
MLTEVHFPELTEMFLRFASGVQQQDSLSQQAELDKHEALGFFKGIFQTISSYMALSNAVEFSPVYRKDLFAYEKKIINFINASRPWKMYFMQPGRFASRAMPQQHSQPTQVCSNENQIDPLWEFQELYGKIQMLKECTYQN